MLLKVAQVGVWDPYSSTLDRDTYLASLPLFGGY